MTLPDLSEFSAPAEEEYNVPAETPEEKEETIMKKILTVEGMMCANCQKHVQKALAGVPGVTEAVVDLEGGKATVAVPAEIDVGGSEFYDYETKYVSDESSFFIPARVGEETLKKASAAAGEIFRILGCRGLSRVDFFLTAEGDLIFNEINTMPGFTPISMYPKLMEHTGIGYSELIDRLIASAMKK